ncbi:hypothetical protein ACIBCA_20920 [Kitasatospora sp. NPDC051170]|uniref:hypothetical protein n=1 Tax=Kitasatospora sp. NPDC051170 TaxID=3364056 RepID=UPI0037A9A865
MPVRACAVLIHDGRLCSPDVGASLDQAVRPDTVAGGPVPKTRTSYGVVLSTIHSSPGPDFSRWSFPRLSAWVPEVSRFRWYGS